MFHSDVQVVKTEAMSELMNTKMGEAIRNKPSNRQLPKICHENGTWRKYVIPTLFRWAGVQPDPFIIPDAKVIAALGTITDTYYGDSVELDISPAGAPARLVSLVSTLTYAVIN